MSISIIMLQKKDVKQNKHKKHIIKRHFKIMMLHKIFMFYY